MSHPEIHMMWMEAYHPLELPNQAAFASSPLPSGIASGSPLSSWNLLTWLFWVEQGLNLWFSCGTWKIPSIEFLKQRQQRWCIGASAQQNFGSNPWSRTQDKPAVSASKFNPKPNRALKPLRGDYGSRMFSTLPLHQWSVGPARDQRCVFPKKTSAKMKVKAINSNHTQIFLEKKTYIYKNKNQSWNCFENVDNQQMLCFTTKRSLFYLSNFQPPRPAHGKHGNSIQQTLQPPHWQHHLSPGEFLATRRPAWFSSPCPGKEAKNLLQIVWDGSRLRWFKISSLQYPSIKMRSCQQLLELPAKVHKFSRGISSIQGLHEIIRLQTPRERRQERSLTIVMSHFFPQPLWEYLPPSPRPSW